MPNTRNATERDVAREQRAFGKLAVETWLAIAAKVGCPYTTTHHQRQVGELAIQATRWATEKQILRAISQRMVAASSPVRIPEWARLQAADDRETDHKADVREEAEAPADPRVLDAMRGAVKRIRSFTAAPLDKPYHWTRKCVTKDCARTASLDRNYCLDHEISLLTYQRRRG